MKSDTKAMADAFYNDDDTNAEGTKMAADEEKLKAEGVSEQDVKNIEKSANDEYRAANSPVIED